MAVNIQLGDVVNPQRLAMLGAREHASDPPSGNDQRLMIVYTGWIDYPYGIGDPMQHEDIVCFVPNQLGQLQTFLPGDEEVGGVEAVVTASLKGVEDEPDLATIDRATIGLEKRTFEGVAGNPRVLILRTKVAAKEGAVHGLSYQVTVLTHPGLLDQVITPSLSTTP